jgi:hypothetical protein
VRVRGVRRRELRLVASQHRVGVLHELPDTRCRTAARRRRRRCLRPAAATVEEVRCDAGEVLGARGGIVGLVFVLLGCVVGIGVVVIGFCQL